MYYTHPDPTSFNQIPNWLTYIKELGLVGLLGAVIGSVATLVGTILSNWFKTKRSTIKKRRSVAEDTMIAVTSALTVFENEMALLHETSIELNRKEIFSLRDEIKKGQASFDRAEALARIHIDKEVANLIKEIRMGAWQTIEAQSEGNTQLVTVRQKKVEDMHSKLGDKIRAWVKKTH